MNTLSSAGTGLRGRLFLTLFLVVLGLGYLSALVNLYLNYRDNDLDPGLSVGDVIAHFHGSPALSRLVIMINGPMRPNLKNQEQKERLEQWIAGGATREGYLEIREIFQSRCVECHDIFGKASFSPLTTYEELKPFTEPFQGISWGEIAKLSHQHLFGMGFIFFLTGLVVLRTERWRRLKIVLLAVSLGAVLGDIGSWWLTKPAPLFAYLAMLAGAVHASGFYALAAIALAELWIPRRIPGGRED